MITPLHFRRPLLALFCVLLAALAFPGPLGAADSKASASTKPGPTLKNTTWSVAWKDGEGVAVTGKMSFNETKVLSTALGFAEVSYTIDSSSWTKSNKPKIHFKGKGTDSKGNALTITGGIENSDLSATLTIKTKDGDKTIPLAGNPSR